MALIGIKTFGDGVEVTGLSASGTTDDLGTWNVGINIATLLNNAGYTLPTGTTAICVRMTNMSTSAARWGGIRPYGKTSAPVFIDQISGNEDNITVAVINTANNLMDFYTESIGESDRTRFIISHALVGYVAFDPDAGLPSQGTTANALVTRTITEAPANSTVLCRFITSGQWCPTTETTLPTNNITGFHYIKLDGSQQVKLKTTGTLYIHGYWPDGVATWEPWLASFVTPTADSTWRASTFIKSGKIGAFGFVDKSSTSIRMDSRAKGSTRAIAPTSGMSSRTNTFFTNLDSNGESEYWYETGGTGNFYYLASFDEYTGGSASVITPTNITPGETFTVIPTGFSGALTSLTATDAQGNTLTLSVTSNQATMPALSAGVANLLFGDVTIECTDGTDTASDTSSYIADTGYSYIDVGTPLIDGHSIASGLADDGITVAALDQIYYPTAYATSVASNTTIESNLLDDYVTLYYIVGTDHNGLTGGMVYQVDYYFDTYGGGSVVINNTTNTKLTSVGLTSSGLTSSGL